MAIRGNYAYVTGRSTWGYDGKLTVVDISDPTAPYTIDTLKNIRGNPLDIHISGNYAYITACDYYQLKGGNGEEIVKIWAKTDTPLVEGGIRVVNISNPHDIHLVASYDTPGDPRGVFVVDSFIFVADLNSLQILNHIHIGIEEQELKNIKLVQNYPNPFRERTTIVYQVQNCESIVNLRIYDISGKRVKQILDKRPVQGDNRIIWDGRDDAGNCAPSGIYFCLLTSDEINYSKKVVFTR